MAHTTIGSSARERYRATTPASAALHDRATASLPGGNTRTTIYVEPYPYYLVRGDGCRIWDADGIERLDFINNYTSLILGHSHPRVVEAIREQAGLIVSGAAPHELEIELAEAIKQRLPSVELVRFANSGTEGTMMAIRAARAFTGRTKIAKFSGGYHGTHDYASVDGGAAGATGTGSAVASAGIPAAVADTMVLAPFNDPDETERVLARHSDDLAAVIVEPIMGAAGVIPGDETFLRFLRELTQSMGALLVFDEVISFRIGYHGAQGRHGITPDLTTLGKIIGGGLPVGGFGGRGDIMELFDPRRPGYLGHGGTFNANPLTLAGGLATLGELTPDVYERLDLLGSRLREGLEALFASSGIPAQVNQVASLFAIHATAEPVTDYASAQAADRALMHELHLAMLNHGVAFTGRGMGCLSTPMGEAEIDQFVDAVRLGLDDLGVNGGGGR
jgi:glutamate-1-semialdehyde 2,1-aminomutase